MKKTDCEKEKKDGDKKMGTFIVELLTSSPVAVSFIFAGPAICMFGPEIPNVVITMQALLQANFQTVLYEFANVKEADMPIAFQQVLTLFLGAMGIAFGMIKNKKFRNFTKGVTMGGLMTVPLMSSLTKPIFEAGGIETCAPTPKFPGGTPCEPLDNFTFDDADRLMYIWVVSGIPFIFSLILGTITSMADG